jgi:hypothetical protein
MGRKSRGKGERKVEAEVPKKTLQPAPSAASRFFQFAEHTMTIAAIGIVGGLGAFLYYGPVLTICFLMFVLALHRSKAVAGLSFLIQMPCYLLVVVFTATTLYGLGHAIESHKEHPLTAEEVWVGHTAPVPTTVINNYTTASAVPEGQVLSLKQKTDFLANQILDFVYDREGPINQWKQEAIAQSVLDAMDRTSRTTQFQKRLQQRNQETQARFLDFYWPQVIELQQELLSAGINDAPLQRAVALGGPRKIGLMLSVIGAQMGKRPPFARILTPTEARVIIQGSLLPAVEVYALMSDANSREVAEVIRREIEKQHVHVNGKVYSLPIALTAKSGISLVYPSADWTTEVNNLIPGLEEAELQVNWNVKPMRQPPSILKIEVRPQSADWRPSVASPSLIVR